MSTILGSGIVFWESGTLTKDCDVDRFRKGFVRVYEVELQAGGLCTIDLESTDFDAFVRVEDAMGRSFGANDDGGFGTNARLTFPVLKSGVYRIYATCFYPDKTGHFVLTVRR